MSRHLEIQRDFKKAFHFTTLAGKMSRPAVPDERYEADVYDYLIDYAKGIQW
jgi:hypothetical protein